MNHSFSQYNESDPLKKVIIGRYKGYREEEAYVERVNKKQRHELPKTEQLAAEFETFKNVLKQHGVEVLVPEYVGKFVYDQLTPRDIGVTIGNKFVLCNMAKSSRRYEAAGIFDCILEMNGEEPAILIPPEPEMLLEGGDIIVDKATIYVGQTRRTNRAGFEYLQAAFEPDFEVVPVPCRSFNEEHDILHLDCVFNPVGAYHALIYPDGIKEVPKNITDNYKLIEITQKEQKALAANILSVKPNLIVSRHHPDCTRANTCIRQLGIEVLELPFDGAPATGGSFRCCTLPLVRSSLKQ